MKVVVLTGPTGVGKTEVAVALAARTGCDLVSADSRQVYTWLDIGTDKPSPETRAAARFHMVDLVEPSRVYSAADYARDATAVMRRLAREGGRFVVVGGSGLYIRALFEPFFEAPRPDPKLRARLAEQSAETLYAQLERVDPERAAQLHCHDRQRVMRALEVFELTGKTMSELAREGKRRSEFEPEYVVLSLAREELFRRLDARFDAMMTAGLLEEVRGLKEAGFGRDSYVANAYGYAELLAFLDGEMALEEAVMVAKAKTRAYARRQLTWCRGLAGAQWIENASTDETADKVVKMMAEQ